MAGPDALLRARVQRAVSAAFGDEYAAVDPAVHRSQFADYQADVALRLAKALKRKPLEIAQAIAEKLELDGLAEVSVSPPGFVNFRLAESYLEAELARIAGDERLGVALAGAPATVVIDYSGVNVAKEMHVGHLRSTVIGDALARTLAFLGHRTVLQNHVGDWGTPFGMLIEHLEDVGADAATSELSVGSLNEFYQAARKKFEADPTFADRSRRRVVLLQAGDEKTLAAWRVLVDASARYFRKIYAALDVLLSDEHLCGESFYNPLLPEIAADLEARGVARVDQEALCVFPPGFTGREGEPLPLIIRKNDGGYGYAATDLAALRYRTKELGATRVLYVVGAPQQQHLAMVFAAAKLAGYLPEGAHAEHVAFGNVLGNDRKMLKTRSGESVKLSTLIDEAAERGAKAVREKNPDWPEEAVLSAGAEVGVAAIKYVDLSSDRIKDYIFDLDRMVSFEGNTGPYLQYAHARICSIQRKAQEQGIAPSRAARVRAAEERTLVLELLDLELAVTSVADALSPHKLCSYLYELATKLSAFYEACPVLRAEDEATRSGRLLLIATVRRTLALGLSLLGIAAPERM